MTSQVCMNLYIGPTKLHNFLILNITIIICQTSMFRDVWGQVEKTTFRYEITPTTPAWKFNLEKHTEA